MISPKVSCSTSAAISLQEQSEPTLMGMKERYMSSTRLSATSGLPLGPTLTETQDMDDSLRLLGRVLPLFLPSMTWRLIIFLSSSLPF